MIRHGVLRLTFADGLTGEVDVLDRMRGPVFEKARTVEGFADVAYRSITSSVSMRTFARPSAWRAWKWGGP